jgi:hypothetical protein
MQHRAPLVFTALICLIAPIGFALGRWSAATPNVSLPISGQASVSELSTSEHAPSSASVPVDFSAVTIENLGQVEFDHAFELIRSAPKEALTAWTKRLEALPVSPRKTSAISLFFKTLAQIDARTAVDLALSIDRSDPHWIAIASVAVATPSSSLSEVARMYLTIGETRIPIAGELIGKWSATDPEATARFLASYTGRVANDDIAAFIGNWAARDPAAALDWLAKADASRRDAGVYASLYAGWILDDRTAALEDLASHASDKTFKRAVKTISEKLFTESPDDARAFVLTLPAGAQAVAVDQVAGHITGLYFGGDYLHLKPDEVTKWVLTLPEPLWHEHIGYLIDRWSDADARAVDAWLNGMSPGARDRLLAEHCRSSSNSNAPTAAFQSGLRISDPALRADTLNQVFNEMDVEARQELLQKLELSPEEARQLERILKRL